MLGAIHTHHTRFLFQLGILLLVCLLDNDAAAQDGVLDPSFGTDGTIAYSVNYGTDLRAQALALQPDGKIVLAGFIDEDNNGGYNFAVSRLNSDGSPDTGFGSTQSPGLITVDFEGFTDGAYAVAIQGDGKIVVAGLGATGTSGNNWSCGVVRLDQTGNLDPSFSSDGKLIVDVAEGSYDRAWDATIDASGKIVLVGVADVPSRDMSVVRLNEDGSLDDTFDGDGIATFDLSGVADVDEQAYEVTVQADGKVLVAGYGDNGDDDDFAILRLNDDGSLDDSFGTGGVVAVNVGVWDYGNTIAVQSDGKIIVAGESQVDGNYDFSMARLNTDGTLDTSFGTSGTTTVDFAAGYDAAVEVEIQGDDTIILAGPSFSGTEVETGDFAAARFSADGVLDTSFGTDGLAVVDFDGGEDRAYGMAIQDDGNIVLGGFAFIGGDYRLAVARLQNSVTVSVDIPEMPETVTLHSVYPNPFSERTTIRYALDKVAHVRLSVYDVVGRQVKVVEDAHKPAGEYEIIFDGSRLPAGFYLYRLSAGARTVAGRMILAR